MKFQTKPDAWFHGLPALERFLKLPQTMTKKNSLFLAFLLFILACSTPRGLLNKGNYDKAITKAVKKLKKNSRNQNHMLVLEKAYHLAMDQDSSRISYLKKEGNPENWDEIFETFSRMKTRQNKVKPLPQLRVLNRQGKHIRTVDFRFKNFDDEIVRSKEKAAEYYYAHGNRLLEQGGRVNAREAFEDFSRVKELYKNFKDVDARLETARNEGTSRVLVKVRNDSRTVIPKDLEEDLLKISPSGLQEKWIRFYSREAEGIRFDYFVIINLKVVDVSPELVKESRFTETAEIQDGWQYAMDSRGNVMKDSLGNDVKVPKLVRIACDLIETFQTKTARISGQVEFIDAQNNGVLKRLPLTVESRFEYYSLIPVGNVQALKPETRKRLTGPPVPFPNDLEMIHRTGNDLKTSAKSIIDGNDNLFD